MAHAKADFMGTVVFGGPGATKQKPIPYDQAAVKAIVESGRMG